MNGVVVTGGGTIVASSLNLITQGAGENQMIGRKVVVRRITFKGSVAFPANSNASLGNVNPSTKLRLCLMIDKQCNGAAATISQIWQNADIWSLMNLENKSRFKIVKEWVCVANRVVNKIDGGGSYFTGDALVDINWSKKVYVPLEFAPEAVAGTRAIGEIKTNNLFLVAFTEDDDSIVYGRTRLRYTDD